MNKAQINICEMLLEMMGELEQENKILKQNAINNDKVVDEVNWKNKELQNRINKATKEVKELYEMAKEQDSDNVNLIDRLELILKILTGDTNE